MHFAPLNIQSGYSFLQSGLNFDNLFNALKKHYYYFAGCCDINTLCGLPEFMTYAEKFAITPLMGITITYPLDDDEETIVLYILNEEGYKNLCFLSPYISRKELTQSLLFAHSSGLALVIPSKTSQIQKHLSQPNNLEKYLLAYATNFSHFYLGMEIYNDDNQNKIMELRHFAANHNYRCLAFPRILYVEKNHAITLKIVDAIRNETQLQDKEAEGPYYLRTLEEITALYSDSEIRATEEIVKFAQFDFFKKRGTLLRFPLEEAKTSKDYLFFLTHSRLHKLGKNTNSYLLRLDYELEIIDQMGFNDYFLIVQDYVNFAKTNGIIVGPGRGSAAGSLVSYLLNITSIDPLEYKLLFERFLNPSRITLPDIDIDFADERREEVIDYLRNKYGPARVANIITFQTFGAKQALRDIGRIYGHPIRDIDLLSKAIQYQNISLKEAYRTVPAFKKLVDSDQYFLNIVSLASKIEGLPRQSGMHAAGIVINDEAISTVMPIMTDNYNHQISQYEMGYLEDQGLLKMDILGLRNLTIIDKIVKNINTTYNLDLDPMNLPYDEQAIFDLISQNYTMGLFQLESAGMKRAIGILKPHNFEDVVALLALFRPGPMDNIPIYARRKNGLEIVKYDFKELQDILSPTYGIIVYQEQIISIVTAIAAFSLAEADTFRRAISKKDSQALNELRQKFLFGAKKNGHSEDKAIKLYEHILKFADYGFNRSHSVAYALISCQMAYLKVHYPIEFYAGILDSCASSNDSKFMEYLSEIRSRNIPILPPNINFSTRNFINYHNSLLFPLSFVKEVNSNTINEIIQIRQKNGQDFASLTDFLLKTRHLHLSSEQILKLINAGAFDSFSLSRSTMRKSLASLLQYVSLLPSDEQMILDISILPPPKLQDIDDDLMENLTLEEEALGIMLSKSPLALYRNELTQLGISPLCEVRSTLRTPKIAGMIKGKKVIRTKEGANMAFLTLIDETAELEVVVFPRIYDKTYQLLEKQTILIVRGRHSGKDENFIAEEISLWEGTK